MTTAPGTIEMAGDESYSIADRVKENGNRLADRLAAIEAGSQEEKQPKPEPEQPKRGRPSARDQLVKALEAASLELALDQSGEAVARIRRRFHTETHRLRATSFARSARIIAIEAGLKIPRNAVDEALDILEAQAYASGRMERTYRRAGPCRHVDRDAKPLLLNHVNQICVDPGRADWRLYLLGSGNGPELIESDDPRAPWIIRGPAAAALPEPAPGGGIDLLWRFVNIAERDRLLFLAALCHAWRTDAPQPVVFLGGEQGSAKSTSMIAARRFVDASSVSLSTLPRTPDETHVVASSGILVCFDNVSHIDGEISDVLCVVSYGVARLTRRLYTDSDLAIAQARAQIWLNSIVEIIARGDLASRSIVFTTQSLSPAQRRAESDIVAELESLQGLIFDAFLNLVDATLATLPTVELEKRSRGRMADLSDTGEALARVLGHKPGTFDALLAGNQDTANEAVIESSPIAAAIIRRIRERGPIMMSPTGLLHELTVLAGDEARSRSWPQTPAALASAIRRIAPALRAAGFEVETGRNHTGRFIMVQQYEAAVAVDAERHADTKKAGEAGFFND